MNIIQEKIEKYKTTIVISTALIGILSTIGYLYNIQKEKEANEITLDKVVEKKEIKIQDVESDIKPFLKSTNIVVIENKGNVKIPFVEYHDKFFIKIKKYNKNKNFTLNIEGDIRVNDKQLSEQQLVPKEMTKEISNTLEEIEYAVKLNDCKRVNVKNIFIYLNKGVSLTYRKGTEFIQFNALDNKIFIWQERNNNDEKNKYLLCNFNSSKLLDDISDLVTELQAIEKKKSF
jgi:hypothetical protein